MAPLIAGLVLKCSNTLISLTITCYRFGALVITPQSSDDSLSCANVDEQTSLDLPKDVKLEEVVFGSDGSLGCIDTAIETIGSNDL